MIRCKDAFEWLSLEAELKRKFELLVLRHLLYHLIDLSLLLSSLLIQLNLFLFSLKDFLVNYSPPITIYATWNPTLDFDSWHSLHTENLQSHTISTVNSRRHSLYRFIVLTASMLQHGVNTGEFLGTFRTTEMFSLLMVMQNDFVFKWLFAVEAERAETTHISSFTAHSLLIYKVRVCE